MSTIYVFGNPDLEIDALPVRILPKLAAMFPEHEFVTLDPNEDWNMAEDIIVIDTAVGLDEITVFDGLDAFDAAPRLTCHDFDAYFNLRFLKKLGKLKKITIIGIPPGMDEGDAIEGIRAQLALMLSSGK